MNERPESIAVEVDEQPKPAPKRSLQSIIEDLAEADEKLTKYTVERAAALVELKDSLPSKRTAVVVTSYRDGYRKVVYLVSPGADGEPLIEWADIADD